MNYKSLFFMLALGTACIWACQPTSQTTEAEPAPSVVETQFTTYCSGCHGANVQTFADRRWLHGQTKDSIILSIKSGYAEAGMPSFDSTFTDEEVSALADHILSGVEMVANYAFQDEAPTSNIFPTEDGFSLILDTVATGLESVWGMAFLPGGDMLISDKNGTLYRHSETNPLQKIDGVPGVRYKGQGGLLDVETHPDFANNSLIYLSYSKPKDDMGTTAIFRAKLDGTTLVDGKDIFVAEPYTAKTLHYGSRLEFDKEGYLFFTIGDRHNRDVNPQSLDKHFGKVYRISDDGTVPSDNPFVDKEGAITSIWSYGHRNPQGLAMNPETGEMWDNEHGPRGGDELNLIQKGMNYGWPLISYGINYNGTTFTTLTEKEGMEQPVHYWTPSIGVCGMTFIKGDRYPGWENQILVGSLRYKYLSLVKMKGNEMGSESILLKNIGRLRSVEMGLDNYIYVGVERPGMIFRLVPRDESKLAVK